MTQRKEKAVFPHPSKRLYRLLALPVIVCSLALLGVAHAAGSDHDNDYRTFHTNGEVEYGNIKDSYKADLVIYLAGNQFMVMEDLIKDFQRKNPDIEKVYVQTIPPGQILNEQLLKQGKVDGKKTSMHPDLYGGTTIEQLKILAAKGKMHDYMTYVHNKLTLMVPEGNPKKVKGPEDLTRDDLVLSLPNPLTEGINKFVTSMLKDLNIYDEITGDQQCKECWAVKDKTWFTDRHHRDTPKRIVDGDADVGVLWSTEVVYAKRQGSKIEEVEIPAPYNKQDEVGYVMGALQGKNTYNALRFLSYLGTADSQNIYESHGFIGATAEERTLKPIPND